MIKVFLNSYGLIKLGFKSQSKITRKLVILDVYDGSQGRHPKRDLKPRFISPYPFKNPILCHQTIQWKIPYLFVSKQGMKL